MSVYPVPDFAALAEAREAEHRRRMQDPEYRAQYEAAEARQREAEARMLADERDRRRNHAGIPRRFRTILDGELEHTEALRVARGFLADPGAWLLVLAGPPGVGKTVAAAWFLDEPSATNGGRRFLPALEVARRGIYGEDATFWNEARGAGRLVIDDLGTEPLDAKGYAFANLAALLAHRHANEAKTLITSNLTLDAFRARYLAEDGGRLADRFREGGTFYELRGESRRGSGRTE